MNHLDELAIRGRITCLDDLLTGGRAAELIETEEAPPPDPREGRVIRIPLRPREDER